MCARSSTRFSKFGRPQLPVELEGHLLLHYNDLPPGLVADLAIHLGDRLYPYADPKGGGTTGESRSGGSRLMSMGRRQSDHG